MVIESLWCNLKHRHLHKFNCPWLDLVTHVIISDVLPRVQRTLEYVQGLRQVGWPKELAGWKTDFRADWMDMAQSDEHWLVEKELKWLKAPKKTKGHNEQLAKIAKEENHPCEKYLTEIDHWTCSCPAYLISQFLLCKHLVRKADKLLNNQPHHEPVFFANMKRQHYPPYYSIEGIHFEADQEETQVRESEIRVLGRELRQPQQESNTGRRHSEVLESPASQANKETEVVEKVAHDKDIGGNDGEESCEDEGSGLDIEENPEAERVSSTAD